MIQTFKDSRAGRFRRRRIDTAVLLLGLAVAGFAAAFLTVVFLR
jgi:hypothetical protein